MKKTLLCIATLLCASSAFAGERALYTTKDGAGYEASLRKVGIPLSGGMVWPVLSPNLPSGPAVQTAAR